MNLLTGSQSEMQEDSLWRLCPVQDIDAVLTNRYGRANNTLSLLYCDLYLRQFKETLKQTMLDQESVFEDQIHELHRLYQRQKALMMEMEETNNLYGLPQHLFLNAAVSSPRKSTHWLGSSISIPKTSLVPPEDPSAKIDETVFSGDESGEVHEVPKFPKDQSRRSMSLESVVQVEIVHHSTGLSRSKRILDLNEPAKIEEHTDYDLCQFLSPAQKRAEPEAQDPPMSTQSQAEKGIDLNMSPLSPEEEVTTIKSTETEQPLEFVSSRVLVQALPCSKCVSFFQSRSKSSTRRLWPSKKAKRGAKSTKARRGSSLDLNVGVNEDDNHSLGTASYIPETDHNREQLEKGSLSSLPAGKSSRNRTNPGKKRKRCKQHIESGNVLRKIARTRTKTRGSFLVTEDEDQIFFAAAEAIVDMSLSDSARKSSIKTSDRITPLHWFAEMASSVVEDSKSELGFSLTGSHSDYHIYYFEAVTLRVRERRSNTSISNIVTPKQKRTPRCQQKRQLHKEFLPRTVASQESLIKASETNDANSSMMENMVIDWGTIRKRRRGIRSRPAATKTTTFFCRFLFQILEESRIFP